MYSEKGQTLLELVVVVTVMVLVVGALVFAIIASLRNAQFAKNQAQATKLAQEYLEQVRYGRDRNLGISITGNVNLTTWNGYRSVMCSIGPTDIKSDAIWCYHISGDCDRPDLSTPGRCYFSIDTSAGTGQLTNIGFALTSFPESAPGVSYYTYSTTFKRVVILSDDLNHDKNFNNDDWQNQKEVTVIMRWTDFSGPHESRLTTILRRI